MKNNLPVYLMAATALLLWGMSYIWSDSLIDQHIPQEYFIFIRSVIGAVLLFFFNIATGVDMRLHLKDVPIFLLLSFCEPFVNFLGETHGIELTQSPSYASMMGAVAPMFSLIAGVFLFGEKISRLNVLGFFLCAGGVLLTTFSTISGGNPAPYFAIGVILLLIAALSDVGLAACTHIIGGRYRARVITMYQFLFGSVMFFPLFVTKGLEHYDKAIYMSWSVWRPILCLAVLCTCLSFTLWATVIKKLGIARTCVLISVIPIITAVAGEILGIESLSILQMGGIAVVCVGIGLSQVSSRPH